MDAQETGYYLGIKFAGSEKSYYFACPNSDFSLGELVIVMTANGVEAGKVSVLPQPLSSYRSNLELKSILRKADKQDLQDYEDNLRDAKKALAITREEIEALSLPMDLIDAYYSLDGSKVTISYTSPEKRVDFRELLKVLAPQLGARIELRQIASRDKAKMVGGIGVCGLPLCCSTFLNQFEGISIQRAKNQMLTLNIPKLSGACGKLICCLTYEDDAYTEAKKEFPHFGTVVHLDEGAYTVDAINVLSRTVRLVDATRSDFKTFPLNDVKEMLQGTYKKKVEIVKPESEKLPSFGIEKTRENQEKLGNSQQNKQISQENRGDRNNYHRHGKNRNNRHNQNRQEPPQNNERPLQQEPNKRRHRHRHHGHGNRGQGGNQQS